MKKTFIEKTNGKLDKRQDIILVNRSVKQGSFGFLRGRGRFRQSQIISLESSALHLRVDDAGIGRERVGDLLGVFRILVILQRRNRRAAELSHVFGALLHHDLLLLLRLFKYLVVHRDLSVNSLRLFDCRT